MIYIVYIVRKNYLQQKLWPLCQTRGFLYVDLLITLCMLSLTALAIGRSVGVITQMAHDASNRSRALHLATQYIDYCLITRQCPLSDTNIDEFTISYKSTHIPVAGTKTVFLRICVTVSWPGTDTSIKSISLSDGYCT